MLLLFSYGGAVCAQPITVLLDTAVRFGLLRVLAESSTRTRAHQYSSVGCFEGGDRPQLKALSS